MNGLENLRYRLNGQGRAKNNLHLITCLTLKDQWYLPINALVLFGFDAFIKINLIENVTHANSKTQLLRLAGC